MNAEKALSSLWQSLQRAGNHFGDECLLDGEEEPYQVTLKVTYPISEEARMPLLIYMTSFLKDCGWRLTHFKIKKGYATFLLRAASNRS